ncbi:ROK family protein [Catellatospora sp. NPDC049133]|uniref:ROK family protein n=1 Tax=Catellatospora sp. NPDC049133 TaxID=3155499 RepID=UPI00340E2AEE
MLAIGLDLGGHGVKSGIVRLGTLEVNHYEDLRYNAAKSNRAIAKSDIPRAVRLQAVIESIQRLIRVEPTVGAIGLASTGIIDSAAGIVLDDQAPDYVGTDWLSELRQNFGNEFYFHVENDAKCAVWGEYVTWNNRPGERIEPPSSLVQLTIGSGIGAGVVLNGQILSGANYVAGEFGSLPFRSCGSKDSVTIESISAAPGLLRNGKCDSLVRLNELYSVGNKSAVSAVALGAEALGHGLAAIINILGPAAVIFSGGVVDLVPSYKSLIIEQAKPYCEPAALKAVKFVEGSLGRFAGLVGAGNLALSARRSVG